MVLKLKNGQKFTIEQPQENPNGIMRGRQRATLEIPFVAEEQQFSEIQFAFTADNLESITVYYPDHETEDTPDEQLQEVAQKEFLGYQLIGEWKNEEFQQNAGEYGQPPIYKRKLSVVLGQLQYGETVYG